MTIWRLVCVAMAIGLWWFFGSDPVSFGFGVLAGAFALEATRGDQ